MSVGEGWGVGGCLPGLEEPQLMTKPEAWSEAHLLRKENVSKQ